MENIFDLSYGARAVHMFKLVFLMQRRWSNNKDKYHDCPRAGGVLGLNQKYKLQRRTMMNSDELVGNPNEIQRKGKKENLPELLSGGGAGPSSGQIRVMQWPLSMQ